MDHQNSAREILWYYIYISIIQTGLFITIFMYHFVEFLIQLSLRVLTMSSSVQKAGVRTTAINVMTISMDVFMEAKNLIVVCIENYKYFKTKTNTNITLSLLTHY